MSDPNPVMTDAEAEAIFTSLDAADIPTIEAPSSPDAQENTETTETETSDGQSDVEESTEAGTEEASSEKSEEAKTEPEKSGETKPQSKYEKEKVRQQNAWQKINEEKEALKKQREEVERLKAEAAQQAAKQPEPARDKHGYSAKDYEDFVENAKNDPDADERMVAAAKARAKELREQETTLHSQAETQARIAIINKTVAENPELNDLASPLAKELRTLIEQDQKEPFFARSVDGFARMVELAKFKAKAASVPALEKQLTDLKKEVDRLTKLTTPAKSGSQPAAKKAASGGALSEAEMEAMMAKADAQGIPVFG